MPLPLYAKVDISLTSLFCFLLSLGLLYDPSTVVDGALPRLIASYTGLKTASVHPEARDAHAFAAYGLFIVGLAYAIAVWEGNERFARSVGACPLSASVR
ncbi:hypothetical protein CALCODRAFT_504566 [Calocera cornea HHB12733]|uniref:Uncharacterized protein n=1 Tax=Calocera cornea HHB12733 TaxID=1353952 RepID=A0A165CC90_9BASI|nr:hypothetical protein CALCODRAFT_504566 [Calocera cornea HHB12733]